MSAAPSSEPSTALTAPETTSLATLFKYWPHTTPSAFEVAEAGFRYIGKTANDHVICPHCRYEVWSWIDDNELPPWKSHQENSPDCRFFKRELDMATKYAEAPYRPPPPSRSTDQTILLQQSITTTPPTTQTTATSSPPSLKPNHLTIQDLYTRYAPLNNRQFKPFKTLPTMKMDELFKKFDKTKPATTSNPPPALPKPRQQRARPCRSKRAKAKAIQKKANIHPDNKPLYSSPPNPTPTARPRLSLPPKTAMNFQQVRRQPIRQPYWKEQGPPHRSVLPSHRLPINTRQPFTPLLAPPQSTRLSHSRTTSPAQLFRKRGPFAATWRNGSILQRPL